MPVTADFNIENGTLGFLEAFTLPVGGNDMKLKTFIEKSECYIEMLSYLQNLTYSLIKCKGFDDEYTGSVDLDADYFTKIICNDGKIAFCHTDSGILHLPFTAKAKTHYKRPTQISIEQGAGTPITPPLYDYDKSGETAGSFEIVYLNKAHTPLFAIMSYYAGLYAMGEQLIRNNVISKSLQTIIEGRPEQRADIQNIIEAIFNQCGILTRETPGNARDIADMLRNNPNNTEWIADKVIELETSIINRYLSRIGINHVPYEKRERLTNEEIKTNDMSLDLLRFSMLNTINEGLARVNKKFNLNLSVELNVNNLINKESEENNENVEIQENPDVAAS